MATPNFVLWNEFQAICVERQLDPQIITYPERFKDFATAAKRMGVLRELHKRGARVNELTTICGLKERTIQEIIQPTRHSGYGD